MRKNDDAFSAAISAEKFQGDAKEISSYFPIVIGKSVLFAIHFKTQF